MYYIVCEDSGQIIESSWSVPSLDELRTLAEQCECDLWVIEGQHSGITVKQPNATNQAAG